MVFAMPSTTRSTPQSGRRVRGWLAWILVVVGSVVFFVPLAVFWAMVLFDATLMGQCGYEEVRCPGAGGAPAPGRRPRRGDSAGPPNPRRGPRPPSTRLR